MILVEWFRSKKDACEIEERLGVVNVPQISLITSEATGLAAVSNILIDHLK